LPELCTKFSRTSCEITSVVVLGVVFPLTNVQLTTHELSPFVRYKCDILFVVVVRHHLSPALVGCLNSFFGTTMLSFISLKHSLSPLKRRSVKFSWQTEPSEIFIISWSLFDFSSYIQRSLQNKLHSDFSC